MLRAVDHAAVRELLIRSAGLPMLYPEGGMASHLVTLLLDEIAIAPVGNLHLPMPSDARLRGIVDTITADPTERGTMETWARRVGMSERTLARALAAQTGMSFGRWRQQLHLMLAVQWLGAGQSVQHAAGGRRARLRERQQLRVDVPPQARRAAGALHGGAGVAGNGRLGKMRAATAAVVAWRDGAGSGERAVGERACGNGNGHRTA